jgi:hypothetical protein
LVICDWLLGKKMKMPLLHPPCLLLLEVLSLSPVGRCGPAAPTLGIMIYRQAAKFAKERGEEEVIGHRGKNEKAAFS